MSNVDFGSTRNEIIERALRNIGALGQDQNPTAYQVQKATLALNSIVKNMGMINMLTWRISDESFDTVDGTVSYTPTEGIIGFRGAFCRIDDEDYALDTLSWESYQKSIPLKSGEGRPSSITWKDDPTSPAILVYPVPNGVYEIHYEAVYKLKDFDNASDANLFPARWEEVLTWQLSAALCHEYGLPVNERYAYENKAKRLLEQARIDNFDYRGHGETFFEPA